MPQIRQFPWPEFLEEPSPEQLAPLAERVRSVIGAEKLADLLPVQIRSIERSGYKRLQQMGGDHRLIADVEIEGWLEIAEECWPKAFYLASQYLQRRKEGMN